MTADTILSTAASDLHLVERHRYGDPAAFDQIYREHEAMVYNLALRLGGDAERAADLTQEIFLRVYRHLDRFRGASSLKTWIYRVAVNHCRSRMARRRRRALLAPPAEAAGLERLTDPARGPEELALADGEARRLERALGELPPRFREAVVLRDLEELSYDEIAEVLRVRIGTVRSRIARGRDRLRTALEEADR